MAVRLFFTNENHTTTVISDVLDFRFIKDKYSPYTQLSCKFISSGIISENVTEVMFLVGNKIVHHGYIDRLDIKNSGNIMLGTLSSKNFTSLLIENQMEPGMYTNISINKLMDNMMPLPYITHENNSDESNYIYIKNGAVLWDGIVNLCYKLYGSYPYIRSTNCIMLSYPQQVQDFSYSSSELLSTGSQASEKRMTSDFHMADINGNYGTYDLTDRDVSARNIVRHRYYDLDRQFLYSPQDSLVYHDKFAKRAWKRYYCSYSGYLGEDLADIASFGNITSERIGRIEISGSAAGIFTEISVYHDDFP